MESEQFRTQRESSSRNSEMCPPQTAAQRAALLFGCYRRGDANDPDTYSAAVAAVLSRFPQGVVEYVTDPRTGIAGTSEWLPSVAEVKRACTERQSYLDRLDDYDRRFGGRKPLTTRLLPPEYSLTGSRANVFVGADAPQYARACELAAGADPSNWKHDEAGRPGIWIALHLFEAGPEPAMRRWRSPTDADLRAMYGPRNEGGEAAP